MEQIKAEDDTMKRVSWFVLTYINNLGRIPTVDEAETEYVAKGLNRNSRVSTLNRRKRIEGAIKFYSKEYDESKAGFKLNWSGEKSNVLNKIQPYLPEKMTYTKGKKTMTISPEEIGFFYKVISKMEESDQHIVLANSLSYKQADELFLSEFGKRCGRHKISGIIKILLKYRMIKKVRNYKAGLRGNCYKTII